jgi:Flp pilus assembly protein TadD
VHARGNSLLYSTSKFVRRNRVAVAAGAAVLAALLFGLVSARRSERTAEAEAQHANIEAESFQSIVSFLMDGFLPVQPAQDAAWQERARERIVAQAERVHRQYASSDHMRANLLDALGQVCSRLDLFEDAERLEREALAIREQAYGRQSLEYALSLRSLGQLKYQLGEYGAAAQLLAEALTLHRAAASGTHADIPSLANDLAACLRSLGREAEAEVLHREALALRREREDGTLPVAESLNNLAGVHLGRGEYEVAVAELREALTIRDSILGSANSLTLQTTSNLAGALWRHGDRAEARDLMQRAESGYRSIGDDGADGLGIVLANLAAMQLAERDLDGAAASLEEALALQTRRLGDDHPLVAVTLAKLAQLHHSRHRDAEACRLWEEVLRIRRSPQGSPRDLAEALCSYGVLLTEIGERERAERLIDDAIELHRSHELNDPAGLGRAEFALGSCLSHGGNDAQARQHMKEAARLLDATPAATADERARVHKRLEELERRAGG